MIQAGSRYVCSCALSTNFMEITDEKQHEDRRSSDRPVATANICQSNARSVSPWRGSNHRSAASVIALTMLSPKRSTVCSGLKAIIAEAHGHSLAVEYATLEWGDWCTNRSLLAPIGNIPPAEAEFRNYAMLDDRPVTA
jgi:hypothetical protein